MVSQRQVHLIQLFHHVSRIWIGFWIPFWAPSQFAPVEPVLTRTKGRQGLTPQKYIAIYRGGTLTPQIAIYREPKLGCNIESSEIHQTSDFYSWSSWIAWLSGWAIESRFCEVMIQFTCCCYTVTGPNPNNNAREIRIFRIS